MSLFGARPQCFVTYAPYSYIGLLEVWAKLNEQCLYVSPGDPFAHKARGASKADRSIIIKSVSPFQIHCSWNIVGV